ncbi:MAG: orotate phosphoribosyltransferase [Burkholderiaceae bacterium]|jgi:orotate phosphoribosyltransferase|nr:orotate phosphoribosyltransferase [Burkholderiaceae bacterium]
MALSILIANETMVGANLREDFIRFALDTGVLRFGEFLTKAGRKTPYFFNAGLFNDGQSLGRLADFYAKTLLDAGTEFDMLFGPAYKGIPLVAAVAMALSNRGRNVPFAYNRKEIKDHGEGGSLIGAPLKGRVVIVDDVISAGTSVNESVNVIHAVSAKPVAVLIALDRMERSGKEGHLSPHSAVQEVQQTHRIPVLSIANLDDLLHYLSLEGNTSLSQYRPAVEAYRQHYGA